MPKRGTITFEIEPVAVLEAAGWLIKRDPYSPQSQSLIIASLSAEDRERREAEHWVRVREAVEQMLGWLGRRNRLATPNQKFPLCLERRVVEWMAKFDRPRVGGIFASKRPATSMPAGAEYFFLRCRLAMSRRVGRPRYTDDQIARRLAADTQLADSSFYRLAARQRDSISGDALAGLMKAMAERKLPN